MKPAPTTLAAQFSRMDLLSSVPPAILEQLAAETLIEHFATDAVVFHKNEPGHSLYLILQGCVKVHDEDYTVAMMPEGTCFGELALLDEGPRSMSVTATEPTTLAVIGRDVFFQVLRNDPDVLRKIVGTLTQRLRYQTDRVVEELRRREEELTRLVDERTAQLMQQKEEAELLRAKAEAEKQEAEYQRQRAEQSERFEQQFLANMSHEIRTPMNAVLGMTNILLQKKPRPDQLKYLDSIRHASEALLVILNDILDISKIEAGRMELEHTDFSPAHVVEQVANTLRFRAAEKGLAFETICAPDVPPVLIGDPVRLQQILLNLTGNAVKFTEQGSVRLDVRLLKKETGTCWLRFEVRDTGVGMTPAQTAAVFERFRQAADDTTRRYGGTGLGLAISKQLVELFGGHIEVQSAPGQGSVFSFDLRLPISKKTYLQKKEETTATPVHRKALESLRILVAEDNEYNRVVAVETLELMLPDATIELAHNGLEALEKVKTGTFDLVLMDVNMPEMDGLEATRAIRALPPPLNALPIVAFTASVTKAEIQQCKAAGMNAVVPKPFRESELMEALHKVASNREGSDETDISSAPAATSTPPGAHALTFLEQMTGGDHNRIQKYIGLYLASAQTSLPKIEAALRADDREALRRVVHTLKPQLKMIGLPQTAELATRIEARLLEGTAPQTMVETIEQLLKEIRHSCVLFDKTFKI
ncbi:MAG: response regulator [Saprospiraceae bacterium]|nr:response regulator [Saprospiraceae bacterium]